MKEEITEGFQLSPQQKRLWLLQRDSLAYRVQCVILLEGNLNTEVLADALQKIVNRHEILGTTFHSLSGLKFPVQVIASNRIFSYRSIDLTGYNLQEQAAEIERLFQEERRVAFDFKQGPLLRLSLLALSATRHALLINLPSLCADSLTLRYLVEEISSTYAACLRNEDARGEPIQYADFSRGHCELLGGEGAEAGRAFWQDRDSHLLPVLTLPFEGKSPGKSAFEPDSLSLTVEPDEVAKIEVLVKKYDTSVPIFFLACWQTLLWQLTGQQDIVIYTVIDGRIYEELQRALGLFATPLPINSHFEGDYQFTRILRQIHESVNNANRWQEYFPWGEGLDLNENSVEPSSFPVGFEFEERFIEQRAAGIRFSLYKQYVCVDRFKAMLSCARANNALMAEVHYHPALFRREDMRRLAKHLDILLKSAVKSPETPLGELEVMSEDERQQVLVTWNDTKADYPQDQCIQQLFEAQVEQTPDAVAVIFEEAQLNYQELNRQANRLAHYLRRCGVTAGTLVGICIERSLEMIVGLLGILKAGATYVPLAPEYPKARLAYMLQDTQADFLLTQERLLENFPAYAGKVICLDRDSSSFAGEEGVNPAVITTPEDLAYVIYTSGSTGQPKGVLIAHRGVVNYLAYLVKTYDLHRADVVLQVAPLSFDPSVREIMGPLVVGAKLVVVTTAEAREPAALLSKIKVHSVTSILSVVPTMLRGLLEAARDGDPPYNSVRIMLVSGENLYLSDCRKARRVFGDRVLVVNQYGPTECTMIASCYQLVPSDDDRSIALIGRPISNAQLYILNSQLNPVPVYVTGELHVGGIGLARGYLNRPELSSARFIPNPFSRESGTRLYKTGDLARYLPDGNVEFLGRIDHQVKIRGNRVELGEIEAVLSQHPLVQSTAILLRDNDPGEQLLVAYLVPAPGHVPTTNELRRFLAQRLPEYMIPSIFVTLDAIPLTPSGKVDRRALPALDRARPNLEEAFVAPRSPVEEVIAEAWAQVLGIRQVGAHDNFFELGGHSLLATQVIYHLNEVFLDELPLRSLFDAPTVAGLAQVIERGKTNRKDSTKVARLLAAIEQLSAEEVQALLASENDEGN